MEKQSLWIDTSATAKFPILDSKIEVDALIVGGGITGITTAYLLKNAGLRTAVVDLQDIGYGETAHTTAHVTYVTDTRLHDVSSRLGKKAAKAFWDAGYLAMRQIEEIVGEINCRCALRHVPGYLFAAENKDAEKERETLLQDVVLAKKFGFDAEFLESDPLFHRPAVEFPNQLKFHPLKYLHALAKVIPGDGCHVFSHTSGSDIDAEHHELRTEKGVIRYHTLIAATHVPIQGEKSTLSAALLQTKLSGYSTYAIEAEIPPVPESLFWDTNDPYFYFRFDRHGEKYSLILGGEDHKTGQEKDTEKRFKNLERIMKKHFPDAKPRHRWSGQVIETSDSLPYIGSVTDNQYIATGFSGNGITLGTFSAILIRDLITKKFNPWTELFAPTRKSLSATWNYIWENKDFPKYLLKDYLRPKPDEHTLPKEKGEVQRIDGRPCAVYCDKDGKKTVLSGICPHMGCIVSWNDAEKTWDCPCHGSRFMATGEVIAGPAESNLKLH